MQQYSTKYIFGFSALICVVCSFMLSVTAVGLRARQEQNQRVDRNKNILQVCGLMQPGETLSATEIDERFKEIETKIVSLETGEYVDAEQYDPNAMNPAGDNLAGIQELPVNAEIYLVMKDGKPSTVVLPVYGKGLWSVMYGFLALDADGTTVRGLTYYQQGETPGLGGEVDNPKWKALWKGRKAFDATGKVAIAVIKGKAGSVEEDPHHVDGLSGATLTSRGVSNTLNFWLGERGFGPFLEKFKARGSV